MMFSSRRTLHQVARRSLSSNSRVGTVQKRAPSTTPPPTSKFPRHSELAAEQETPVEVPVETRRANAALAASLGLFCLGVAYYSMNAVGQSGSSPDDPLAQLKEEAAQAQQQQDKSQREQSQASEMLKQFQSGGFDPDKYEEMEEEAAASSRKPWWKFW